jgi:hypothetical protein
LKNELLEFTKNLEKNHSIKETSLSKFKIIKKLLPIFF